MPARGSDPLRHTQKNWSSATSSRVVQVLTTDQFLAHPCQLTHGMILKRETNSVALDHCGQLRCVWHEVDDHGSDLPEWCSASLTFVDCSAKKPSPLVDHPGYRGPSNFSNLVSNFMLISNSCAGVRGENDKNEK